MRRTATETAALEQTVADLLDQVKTLEAEVAAVPVPTPSPSYTYSGGTASTPAPQPAPAYTPSAAPASRIRPGDCEPTRGTAPQGCAMTQA